MVIGDFCAKIEKLAILWVFTKIQPIRPFHFEQAPTDWVALNKMTKISAKICRNAD